MVIITCSMTVFKLGFKIPHIAQNVVGLTKNFPVCFLRTDSTTASATCLIHSEYTIFQARSSVTATLLCAIMSIKVLLVRRETTHRVGTAGLSRALPASASEWRRHALVPGFSKAAEHVLTCISIQENAEVLSQKRSHWGIKIKNHTKWKGKQMAFCAGRNN